MVEQTKEILNNFGKASPNSNSDFFSENGVLKGFIEEFLQEDEAKKTHDLQNIIKNSSPLDNDSWTSKIVSKVRISDLAREFGIDKCPQCNYPISFDDSRGWFCCVKKKYNHTCDFSGNIIDFVRRCRQW